MAIWMLELVGKSARHTVDSKCVNTMVLIKPMRLANGMASRFNQAAMMEVMKKSVPRRLL